jgi:hypothetical protein
VVEGACLRVTQCKRYRCEEWREGVQQKTSERQKLDREEGARREAYVESKFPQAFSKDGEDGKAPAAAPQ